MNWKPIAEYDPTKHEEQTITFGWHTSDAGTWHTANWLNKYITHYVELPPAPDLSTVPDCPCCTGKMHAHSDIAGITALHCSNVHCAFVSPLKESKAAAIKFIQRLKVSP